MIGPTEVGNLKAYSMVFSFVLQVENQDQYDGVMDTFPYDGDELETQPFPRK